MPCGLVFCGIIGCFVGLFVGLTCAAIVGYQGLAFWPAITLLCAIIGFACDVTRKTTGS